MNSHESSSNRTKQRSCPCCIFLNEDLFLPIQPANNEHDETLKNESSIVSPHDALQCIQDYAERKVQKNETGAHQLPVLLVDTHNHAHLKQERHETYVVRQEDSAGAPRGSSLSVVSLTLAVEPADWDDAVAYSATGGTTGSPDDLAAPLHQLVERTLMGLGIHPWYITDQVYTQRNDWKHRLERLLQQHPSAIVGEIGLCKMAKCARNHPEGKARGMEIQREVMVEQMELATRYRRPVSIHCVQQHGTFLELLKDITITAKKSDPDNKMPSNFVPPAMAMHSFTGTAHQIKSLLQWEATFFGEGPNDSKKKKKKPEQLVQGDKKDGQPDTMLSPRLPLLYFGFSHIVNYEMCTSPKSRLQGREAVRAVPLNRLVAESDVHHPQDVAAGTAGAIAYIAWALELPIPYIAEITARNGLAFLRSHLSP
jgi:Tat protein secretion system quality control protein TatD with DNase activity